VDDQTPPLSGSTPAVGSVEHHVTTAGVAVITIKSPARLNALSANMRGTLIAKLHELDSSAETRAVILTGHGSRAFSAGADLTEAQDYSGGDAERWIEEWAAVYHAILSIGVPTVAALNGYAVGAGLQVAMLCDFRVASTTVKAGMPEINDAIPCVTGSWALTGILARSQIADLVLTGRLLSADEMDRWGMVTRVVSPETLATEAQSLAESLAKKDRLTLCLDKEWLRRDLLGRLPAALEAGKHAHATAFSSGGPQKAIEAFLSRSDR
jgi:enoyl-CoA hydratase/carnithine racemase